MEPKPSASTIWRTLSTQVVRKHVHQKGGLDYLPWSAAWAIMMKHYPDVRVEWQRFADDQGTERDAQYYRDGSVSVGCVVHIGDVTREMWLAVMDHKHRAVSDPSATQISNTKMRCMVKAFALFGLGLELYTKDGLPEDAPNEVWLRDRSVFEAALTSRGLTYDTVDAFCRKRGWGDIATWSSSDRDQFVGDIDAGTHAELRGSR